jgi:DNA-binding transcriptional LysR family regulator
MDRKQLRALVAVAEHRSFSGAARSLDTVQSNISAHIARLERELGLTLIDRATTEPTHEGRAVLERARRIEAEFEALDSDVAPSASAIPRCRWWSSTRQPARSCSTCCPARSTSPC